MPPASPALAGGFFTTRATWEALRMRVNVKVRPGIFRVGSLLREIGGVNSEASHPTELVFEKRDLSDHSSMFIPSFLATYTPDFVLGNHLV